MDETVIVAILSLNHQSRLGSSVSSSESASSTITDSSDDDDRCVRMSIHATVADLRDTIFPTSLVSFYKPTSSPTQQGIYPSLTDTIEIAHYGSTDPSNDTANRDSIGKEGGGGGRRRNKSRYTRISRDEELNVKLRDLDYRIYCKSVSQMNELNETTPLLSMKKKKKTSSSGSGFSESLKAFLCLAGPLFASRDQSQRQQQQMTQKEKGRQSSTSSHA